MLNPIKRTLKVYDDTYFFKSYLHTHIVIFHRRRSHFCHVFLYHPLNLFQINCKDVIHKIDFNVFGIFTAEEFFLSSFFLIKGTKKDPVWNSIDHRIVCNLLWILTEPITLGQKIKKVQAKKLVKSNKSIFFFVKWHF